MSAPLRTSAIIVAAGKGERTGGEVPKQYRMLAGKSVLAHGIDTLLAHSGIDEVLVVIGAGQDDLYHKAIGARSLLPPVIGGASRRDSVQAGLRRVNGDIVLIHDAARPFLSSSVIDRLIAACAGKGAVVPALLVVDSLARGDHNLGEAVDRAGILRVQTPQAFRTEKIREAHERWPDGQEATDDAQVARAAGIEVAIVEGDPMLEKLTYARDFDLAEHRIASAMISRTALGFDVHAFAPGDRLWLCGVEIAHDRGLSGHSDADVALHAITDALLGTIGAGDIGDHFPPTDARWRGAASHIFLDHARDLVTHRGGLIDHVDVTIICEQPKVGPHREAMRLRLSELLGIPTARISVKATTTEKLGFTGRSEGIAAQAAVTVRVAEGE